VGAGGKGNERDNKTVCRLGFPYRRGDNRVTADFKPFPGNLSEWKKNHENRTIHGHDREWYDRQRKLSGRFPFVAAKIIVSHNPQLELPNNYLLASSPPEALKK
jgi:hypothetical protein